MTPTTATARRQFFYLARPLAHSVQGSNIPFGNPSLRPCKKSAMSGTLPSFAFATVLFFSILIKCSHGSCFFAEFHIEYVFLGLDLVRIGSGIFRNMLKSDVFVFWDMPQAFFFLTENAHFQNFGHGKFSNSDF